MSWVQQSAATTAVPSNMQQQSASITKAQYQYQQQQHQHQNQQQQQQISHTQTSTANAIPAFTGKTALVQNSLPPPPAKHLQNHVQQIPNPNPKSQYNALSKVPQLTSPPLQQHFNNSPIQQQQQQQLQQQTQLTQQQSQSRTWQQLQGSQQNNNREMQSTPGPLNNWPQQQQLPQQQSQMNMQQQQNAYQQNANSWQQPDIQTVAAQNTQQQQQHYQQQTPNMYENYFIQDQSMLSNQQPQQQQQPQQNQQQYFQQNDLSTLNQQQMAPQQQQYNYVEYDNSTATTNNNGNNNINSNNNNVNNNQTNDGWGDWGDWNDNNSGHNSDLQQQQGHSQQQQALLNTNVIEDSFNTKNNNNNDDWQWKMSENLTANVAASTVPTSIQNVAVENLTPPTTTATTQMPTSPYQQQLQQEASQSLQSMQPLQPPPPVAPQNFQIPSTMQQSTQQQQTPQIQQPIQQQSVDFSVVTSKTATIASTIKPPNTLPLSTTTATTTATPTDSNFSNLNAPATLSNSTNFSNNIPNSVYVSQAKPVTRPSRQFASPPTGNTPLEVPDSNVLLPTPPQAFQNDEPKQTQSIMPPPPPLSMSNTMATTTNSNPNPFKRAGSVKHHRAELLANSNTATPMMTASFDMPPPPPADFANPSALTLEPDNSEILHENQEVIAPPVPISQNITLPGSTLPNAERNQYMQTSPLSENQDDELNLEADSLPPPGLSRLVLGEPELEATQRLVTGTEEPSLANTGSSHMDMEERHADGEDTSVEQIPNVVSSTTSVASNRNVAPDISIDRNLYQVPGESNMSNELRVVTGVETNESIMVSVAPSSTQIRSDQREIELDGENLEDQHQSVSMATVTSRNEPPLEGAAARGTAVQTAPAGELSESRHHDKHNHHSHQTKVAPSKSHSNASTGNDSELEANEPNHSQHFKNPRNVGKNFDNDRRVEKQRRDKQRSIDRSVGSEEASEEYSSERERERERRRGYREGSARSDRGNDERREAKEYQRRREKREDPNDIDREKVRDRYYGERRREATGGNRGERSQRGTRYNSYDADETEESVPSRHDAATANVSGRKDYIRRSMRVQGGGSDAYDERSDRDYDDRYDRSHRRPKRERDLDRNERRDDDRERRERRGPRRNDRGERGERGNDYDTIERRRRGEKLYPRDYEEHRKQSSRNARDSDMEKEQRHARNGNGGQVPDPHFDPRLMYAGYPSAGPYGMDYYYYLARTNPKAYSEFYKKYYEQQYMATMSSSQQGSIAATIPGESISANATIGGGSSSLAATDGRESVHSGRSSAHNEKERYTQAYMSQANQYHRHYQQKAQHHHSQQQQQHQQQYQKQQQQQQQQQMQQQRLSGTIYQNLPLNSTFHGDTSSVASFGSYSRIGRLSAAQSVDNISTVSSQIASIQTNAALRAMNDYYIGKGTMNYTNLDCYADTRSGQISLNDANRSAIEEHRSTPCKFTNFHAVVSLSTGILVTVKPKLTSKGHVGNIVKLQRLGINDASRHLYQIFPGPLVRGLTHKKTIIDFCEEQIRLGPSETTIYARQLTPRSVEKYRGSYTLMWNLLILLLRQNGMVVGTDIAELLLKNQQQFPYQNNLDSSSSRRVSSVSDDGASVESLDGSADDTELKGNNEIQGNDDASNENEVPFTKLDHSDATNVTTSLSEAEITEKFRNYLLYGNVNEALDWATDNNLWGHALFLASKVDRRSHANVMMKFANKLALNDPLQTLYQLMSGRTPSSVMSVHDEKWGDWRPHLSMILSNTSQKPELDRKAITTLGDSLFNRGDLYAAHFCYLMAQVGFGRYHESAVQETTLQQNLPKLVLLGSSHYKNFRDFATNEAIMMTEIYEYACSLNDEKFSLIEFQPYKYLLATRLLDYGFNLKSLMYMEQIAQHIARDPSRYEPSFINKVYEIADRLKYYDPVLEKTLDDQQENLEENANSDGHNVLPQNVEEQKWLQSLRTIAMQYKLDYPVPTASYPSHDYMQSQQDGTYLQSQINHEFSEINKQFNELNLQYSSGNPVEPVFYNPDIMQQPHQQQQQQPQQEITSDNAEQQQQDYNQYQATSMASQANYNEYGNVAGTQAIPAAGAIDHSNVEPYGTNFGPQSQQQQQPSSFYDPSTAQQSYDAYGQGNIDTYGGDYWQQQQQQTAEENVRPTISMPKSKTYDSDDEQQKLQKIQQKNAAAIQGKNNGNATQQNKNDAKDLNKNSQPANQNSGWFGGIWNKLSLKPKNQMILPDDKNPTIVWDAEKKRWVNTDGDEAVEENLKPPPKMSDIMPQQQQGSISQQQMLQQPQIQPPQQQVQYQQQQQPPQQQQQIQNLPVPDNNNLQPMTVPLASSSPLSNYSASAVAAQGVPNSSSLPTTSAPKPPSLQSNMFKMQRNRTLKNSYVDVFNPSGAPMSKATENVLAPVLPPTTVPQGGFFIPDSSAVVGGSNSENSVGYQQQQQQQQETPQFYNPNQFTSGGY